MNFSIPSNHKKTMFSALLVITALLAACSESSDTAETTTHQKPTNSGILKKISFEEWDNQLKQYKPNIVIVDAWAMWCTSCIKRFPHMVTLSEKYRGKGVTFVSLNLDDHTNKEAVADAEVFLTKMNAQFDNFHIDENLIDAFEHFNLIGIPAVFIYDGKGTERLKLTGDNPNSQFTEKDIEASILKLLKEV